MLFWKDNWAGECLEDIFPNIAHFARNPEILVKEVSEATCLANLFVIPITQAAAQELDDLREIVQDFNLVDGIDQRIFYWGNDKYLAAKLYKMAFLSMPAPASFRIIWKSKVTPRVKFFAWLILLDRLNTKNMLSRRHFNVQPNCLCGMCKENEEETIEHLFFNCEFAKKCWDKLGIVWSLEADIHIKIMKTRQQIGLPFFIEIFLIAAWELWKIRNRLVFDGLQATFARWLRNFKDKVSLQSHHLGDDDRSLACCWFDSL